MFARMMRSYSHYQALPPGLRSAVTIGNFDGLHRGHTALFSRLAALAHARNVPQAVLTFEPHPLRLIAPERAPRRIVSRAEKRRLIAQFGVDYLLEQPFTADFAGLSPADFAQQVLVDALGARLVLVGYDFRYGHRREGNTDTLRRAGEALGFEVEVLPALCTADESAASSSRVRRAVSAGQIALAQEILGRPFALTGRIGPGNQRGRGLGFPTANLEVEGELLPPYGVYSGWLEVEGRAWPAVINYGERPTFNAHGVAPRLEAHILDQRDLDLYGRPARLHLLEHLRDEQRFDGPEALKAAISADIEAAQRDLARHSSPAPAPIALDEAPSA